jgi:hypothetical protein
MNSINSGAGDKPASAILIDAHVHIHDCFDLVDFLSAAARNFSAAADSQGLASNYTSVMCLTETFGSKKFEQLKNFADKDTDGHILNGSAWRVQSTAEPVSLLVDHPEFGRIFIIAGKQIVVAERLEVLALGCAENWQDGLPASEVINGVAGADTVAVLPWGFGKWLGKRGNVLRSLLEKHCGRYLFLGDNSGRPGFFREPHEFEIGNRLGIKVLPGSDPLPFASESHRAGSFGCHIVGAVNNRKPWRDLCRQLIRPDLSVRRFGCLESPLRFLRNQLAMQYMIRTGGESK